VVAGVRFTHFILFFRRKVVFWELRLSCLYNRQLRVKVRKFFGLAHTLAIPSGFGRSRIHRNCGYTLLATGFFIQFLDVV